MVEDRLVQLCSFCQRRYAKLRAQDALALLVLAHGSRTLARPGIQQHQLAVCRLVQRIKRQPAACIVDRRFPGVANRVTGCKRLEHLCQRAPQFLALEELPVVIICAVAQRKAGHKVVLVNGGSTLELLAAGSTLLGLYPPACVLRTAARQVGEGPHVAVSTRVIA